MLRAFGKSTKLAGSSTSGPWKLGNMQCAQEVLFSDINASYSILRGIYFNPDGTKMYGTYSSELTQWDVQTPWDITSIASTPVTFTTQNQPNIITFSEDGTKIYSAEANSSANTSAIVQYTLGTAWDISTASFTHSLDFTSIVQYGAHGVNISNDGTKLLATTNMAGDPGKTMYLYTLSTPFALSSASLTNQKLYSDISTTLANLLINNANGDFVYRSVYQGKMDAPYDIDNVTFDNMDYTKCGISYGYGGFITRSGKTMFTFDGDQKLRKVILSGNGDVGYSAPIADAGADQTDVIVGDPVQLDGSGSHDTNTPPLPINYNWTLSSKPSGSSATISNQSIVNPTFTPDVEGDYTASLVVSNGQRSSMADTVNVSTVVSWDVNSYDPFGDGSGYGLWKFDGTYDEESGNYLLGTLGGVAEFVPGHLGDAYSGKGINTLYKDGMPYPAAISAWINFGIETGTNKLLIATRPSNNPLMAFCLITSANGYQKVSCGTNFYEFTKPTDNAFHFFYMDENGKVFLDGTRITITAVDPAIATVGSFRIGGKDGNSYLSKNYIDHLRVFNRVLTDEEINKLYTKDV